MIHSQTGREMVQY